MHNQKTQFLYLHRYLYGGGTTFTAHLLYTLKKKWRIITIRKAVQHYLESKFGIQPLFLYHPFYPYPVIKGDNTRSSTISISRIAFEKNIEIILRANKFLNDDHAVRIYGARRRR